jgi:hypothetical protein
MTRFGKFLTKAWFIIKTFFTGLFTTCIATIAIINVPWMIKLIKEINNTTGWNVLLYFAAAVLSLVCFIAVVYFIGCLVNDSNELQEYKCQREAHNKDGGTIYMDPATIHRSDNTKNKEKISGKK